jgi:hypothetical protein
MRIYIKLWDHPDKAGSSLITPKRKAPLTQNLSGAWEWLWHETILNQIQFCVSCNWRRENHSRRSKHLMELAGNSTLRLNVRQCRTEWPQRPRHHSKSINHNDTVHFFQSPNRNDAIVLDDFQWNPNSPHSPHLIPSSLPFQTVFFFPNKSINSIPKVIPTNALFSLQNLLSIFSKSYPSTLPLFPSTNRNDTIVLDDFQWNPNSPHSPHLISSSLPFQTVFLFPNKSINSIPKTIPPHPLFSLRNLLSIFSKSYLLHPSTFSIN